jgi:large subunit ribosomal protein L4
MIELTVYNSSGQQVDTLKVDESVLGGCIRYPLLKQAIVMYHANKRVGTATTKIFAKKPRDFSQRMPRKQKKLARDSAVLAKLRANSVVVVDNLSFEQPRTKEFAGVLKNLKIDRSCLVAIRDYDENVHKSARNVRRIDVLPIADLNAAAILNHKQMLFTKDAIVSFLDRGGQESTEESMTA